MKIATFSQYLQNLENTSSRIEITKILSELFSESNASEIDKVTYLLLGSIAPRYKTVVFNIADRMMVRAIAKAFGLDADEVTREYKSKGDLGMVAQNYAEKVKNPKEIQDTEIVEIFEELLKIANDDGEGSQERKVDKMANILANVDILSTKYITRITLGKLRLGFSDKTILDALSWFETGGKSKKNLLEQAYNVLPDVGLLAKHVKENGIEKTVKNITPVVGVPVLPALAARLKSPTEMIEKMHEVAVEPKYDGLRIQIHYKKAGFDDGTQVKAFTRNLNETSWMFPELLNLGKYVKADEAIFDSEAVGVDEERKTMANFQTTMTRRRKHDIEQISQKIGIQFCIFDCLSVNGENLTDLPYLMRREKLAKILVDSVVTHNVEYVITKDPGEINSLMKKNLSAGLEGIIVKRVDSKYIAGRTGWRWVKMKEEETSKAKLSDTIDAVVMGYYRGRGKRTVFGLGGFLVGIADPTSREASRGETVIKTLTKIGTGLTDDQFRELKKRLKNLETKDKPKEYGDVAKILIPDVWVTPSLVVEIAADEITKSPNHSSGYALRFPRLVKFRDDKMFSQATSLNELKGIMKV